MPNGKKLSKQTLDKLLKNEIYAGWVVCKKWGLRCRGVHEALVSEKTFAKVQLLVAGRRQSLTPHVRNHPDFPLRQFVVCGPCGTPMTGNWSKGRSKPYGFYRCQKYCPRSSIRKNALESLFLELLDRMTPRPECVSLFRALVLDVWEEKKASTQEQGADALRRRTEALEAKLDRLETAFLFERTISADTYRRQHTKLQEDIALAKMDLHETELDELDVAGLLDYAEQVLASPARQWLACSTDQKQRLQKALFPRGLTFAEGVLETTETCVLFEIRPRPSRWCTEVA
jgi:hypothetical protein